MAISDKGPYKSREFELYVIWKALPPIYRGREEEVLKKLGIEDREALDLLQLKNQGNFAEKYGIDAGTLTDWNKKIREGNLTAPYRNGRFKEMLDNVNGSFIANLVSKPTPSGVRLANELFNSEDMELKRRGYVKREEAIRLFKKHLENDGPILVIDLEVDHESPEVKRRYGRGKDRINREYKEVVDGTIAELYPEE